VEASALRAPASLGRLSIPTPLLRLRSDEQLVALFRAGSEDAFGVIHDRYRQRLFAYVRQMLSAHSRQDAEDVLQDVFVRAFGALRADSRDINVRAWLYRVAHNRCIDHLRRPVPPAADVYDVSRTPLHDPLEDASRREDLRRLVQDVGRLPDQQRSALLMREIDGMSYADLAAALDVTVPAIKSLLVRARIGLVEAAEARNTDCQDIRSDLVGAYDRGVKASGRARKHMRECSGCREYRTALRGVRRSFAALSPGVAGPLAIIAKLCGVGGGGAAAGGAAATGGGGAIAGGGVAAAGSGVAATATACKVAAVVCTAVVTAAGGAVEVKRLATHNPGPVRSSHAAAPAPAKPPALRAVLPNAAAAAPALAVGVTDAPKPMPAAEEQGTVEPVTGDVSTLPGTTEPDGAATGVDVVSGGVTAPPEDPVDTQVPADTEPAGTQGTAMDPSAQAPAPAADDPVTMPPARDPAGSGAGGTSSPVSG
jgi:RNA polymerase sigma factor (sigma-70 family)